MTRAAGGLRLMLAAIRSEQGGIAANLEAHAEVLGQAARARCHLVIFPEMSLTGSIDPRHSAQFLLDLDARPVQALVDTAHEHGVGAVFGVAESAGGTCHITQVYAYQGRVLGLYRKRQLGEGEEGYTAGREEALCRFGALSFALAFRAEGGIDCSWEDPAGAGLIALCSAAPGRGDRATEEATRPFGLAAWADLGLSDARLHARRTGAWVALAAPTPSAIGGALPGLAALLAPDGEVHPAPVERDEGSLVVELPLTADVEPVRLAARVLVLDPSGRVLLVRFRSAARRGWWATPGGGLEAGEHHRAAARRELAEELGRDDIEIGLQIGVRRHTMYFEDRWLTQHERWFLARHEAFDAPRERLAALATEGVDDICWWSAAELAAARELTAPRRLAILIDEIVADRLPAPETDLGF